MSSWRSSLAATDTGQTLTQPELDRPHLGPVERRIVCELAGYTSRTDLVFGVAEPSAQVKASLEKRIVRNICKARYSEINGQCRARLGLMDLERRSADDRDGVRVP